MYFRRSRAKDRIAHLVGCNGRAVLGAEEKPPKAKNDAELAGNNQSDLNDQLRSPLWGGTWFHAMQFLKGVCRPVIKGFECRLKTVAILSGWNA